MNTEKVNIKASMGGYGGKVVTAGTYTGNFCCIKSLQDSVITATGNVTGLTSVTLVETDCVLGIFTSVTVVSGKVILYYDLDGEQ